MIDETPFRLAEEGKIRKNDNPIFFEAALDSFAGNSGSAVFDTRTGLLEGILVRGEKDYIKHPTKNCLVPKVCKEDQCRGEDVTRITNIKYLKANL